MSLKVDGAVPEDTEVNKSISFNIFLTISLDSSETYE